MRSQPHIAFHAYGVEPAPLADLPKPSDAHWQAGVFWRLGVSSRELYRAQFLATTWKVDAGDVLMADGVVTPRRYRDELARSSGFISGTPLDVLNLTGRAVNGPPYRWLETRAPFRVRGGGVVAVFNVQATPAHVIGHVAACPEGRGGRVVLVTRQDLIDLLVRQRGHALVRAAAGRLRGLRPGESAADGIAIWQVLYLLSFAGLVLGAGAIAFRDTMTLLSAALSLVFLVTVVLRLMAAVQLAGRTRRVAAREPPWVIADADLPRYTILVPLFREARVLPQIVANLRALDYPAPKLDIKLILESVDTETIAAARAMALPGNFDIVTVPDGQPRTKPKACNFALDFATGDFAVIFDAEDRPEPDQLRKAVEMFSRLPEEVVCLQAKLNFDNANENWLANGLMAHLPQDSRLICPQIQGHERERQQIRDCGSQG